MRNKDVTELGRPHRACPGERAFDDNEHFLGKAVLEDFTPHRHGRLDTEPRARSADEASEARRDEATAGGPCGGGGGGRPGSRARRPAPRMAPVSLQFPSSLRLPFALILWWAGLTPGGAQARPDRTGALVALDNSPGHTS